MTDKKPTKAQLTKAGKGLQNKHTPEKKESGYARTLAKARWAKK
jgi:hypothetical protein